MTRYLVLANQTASSPELSDAIRQILEHEPDAEFVLLVPATPVEDLLEWQPDDSDGKGQDGDPAGLQRFTGQPPADDDHEDGGRYDDPQHTVHARKR